MAARRHHYVSQCYLKAFAVPRKKAFQTHVFDARTRRSFLTNIENVALERDFNRFEIEGEKTDCLESLMAQFEGELGPALGRVIETGSLRDHNDRELLLNFLCLLAIRNPRCRELFRGFHERLSHVVMNLVVATPERFYGYLKKATVAGYVNPGGSATYQDVRDAVAQGFRIELPPEYHTDIELGVYDKLLDTFFRRRWVVLRAPRDSGGFITSDHPLCLTWSEQSRRESPYPPGFGVPGTEVLVPLSPNVALVGAFELENDEVELTHEGVVGCNGAIIAHAEWQVYARNTTFLYSTHFGVPARKYSKLLNDPVFRRPRLNPRDAQRSRS
jgi:hypothetical protein